MRIRILGTAAAEGWPGLFCGCDTCTRAREAGGKDLRSRASIQIDHHYKIDLPPDTYYHSIRYGLNLSELKCILFTHSHGDHFAPDEIEYFREVFAYNVKNAPVKIYAPPAVHSAIARLLEAHEMPLQLFPAEPFIPIEADHLTFTPIIAAHSQTEECLNYIIQSGPRTVLYASDTGTYPDRTMEFICGCIFDLLIVECTQGPSDHPSRAHMSLSGILELRDRLAKAGALKPDARWIATHFSHNIGVLHDEMVPIFKREGIEVAYDGMEVEC